MKLTKPFNEAKATADALRILDESGLSKKDQRQVLLDLLDENGNLRGTIEGTDAEIRETLQFLRERVDAAERERDKVLKSLHDAPATISEEDLQEIRRELAKLNERIDGGKKRIRTQLESSPRIGVQPRALSYAGDVESPGYLFAKAIEPALRDFKDRGWKAIGVKLGDWDRAVEALMNEQAAVHGATPAAVRYAKELYKVENIARSNMPTEQALDLCQSWARAAEYISNIRELMKEFERRIGLAVWPHNTDSAQNLEALCMALGYCWSTFKLSGDTDEDRAALKSVETDQQLLSKLLSAVSQTSQRVALFVKKTAHIYGIPELAHFALVWVDTNFAKLEIGHKFAASLALTEIPDDIEVKAPWCAWSFVLPDGLFDGVADDWMNPTIEDAPVVQFSRVLCVQDQIMFVVCSNGRVLGPLDRGEMIKKGPNQDLGKMLDSLVRGACLALSDPGQYKKKSIGSSSSTKNKREGGAPDLGNARYMLTAPVTVDLRDVVKMVQRGEKHKGGKLTVQFLVRGHWKNQAHGPGHALRKRIWLQPFWKGPEESRVLLRNYTVKKEEGTDGV